MESTWNSSLVREEAVGQRITCESVSLEKYEKLYGKVVELEKDNAGRWKLLQAAERLVDTLEKERAELSKGKEKLLRENEELKREQESLEPTRRIERLLRLAEKLPAEEKEEVKRLVKELRESS
ncbi:hypothetical protein [Desulfurobacterium crinifex]